MFYSTENGVLQITEFTIYSVEQMMFVEFFVLDLLIFYFHEKNVLPDNKCSTDYKIYKKYSELVLYFHLYFYFAGKYSTHSHLWSTDYRIYNNNKSVNHNYFRFCTLISVNLNIFHCLSWKKNSLSRKTFYSEAKCSITW